MTCFVFAGSSYAGTTQYTYDPLGRLVSATDPSGKTTDYLYDKAGNLLSVTLRASPAPTIVSFTPTSGQVGQAVTISGTNFSPTAAQNVVKFNGTTAIVTAATTTTLATSVPVGATSGAITVITPQGTATSASPFTVAVLQPPQITGFSPAVVARGGAVSIAGTNFAATTVANQVTVNTTNAVVTAATDSSLTMTAPVASGGKVKVATAAGTATSTQDLFIAPSGLLASDIGATGRVSIDGAAQALPLATGKTGLLLFDGTAGTISYKVRATNITLGSGSITVLKPNGVALAAAGSFSSAGGVVSLPPLTDTGTYTIQVSSTSGVGGNVTVGIGQDIEAPLTLGAATDLTIATAGQVARYNFNGVAGTILTLDIGSVALTGSGGTVLIRKPDGTSLYSGSFSTSGLFARLPQLTASGNHTVEIVPFSSGTGTLKLTLSTLTDIDAGVIAAGEAKDISIASRAQQAKLTFAGAAGAQVSINVTSVVLTGAGGSLTVRKPDGGVLQSTSFGASGVALRLPLLPLTGNYVIEIVPNTLGTGSLRVAYNTFTDIDAGVIAVGETKSITIPISGQIAKLTFVGAVGDKLGLSFSGVMLPSGGSVTVKRPDGGVVAGPTSFPASGGGIAIPALSVAGTYTIEITPLNAQVGSFNVALGNATQVDAGQLVFEQTTTISMPIPGQTGKVTFTGAVGDSLYLEISAVSISTSYFGFQVLKPDGSVHYNSGGSGSLGISGTFFKLPTLTAAGTHSIVVTPYQNGTGSLKVAMWTAIGPTVTATTDTVTTTVTIPLKGQTATATFTGALGDSLFLEISAMSITPSNIVYFKVFKPDGSLHYDYGPVGTYVAASGLFIKLPTLTSAGTHRIEFTPYNNSTGSLKVAMWTAVTSGGTLALATPLPVTLQIKGQQKNLTFDGTTGQLLTLNLSTVSVPSGTVQVLSPVGTAVTTVTSFSTSGLNLTIPALTATGTHTVVFIPSGTNTGVLTATLNTR